jgi:hypothetical protein
MGKRIIEFTAKNNKGFTTKAVSIDLKKFRTTKLTQGHVKTDIGYVDVTVSLDRWGRLNAVFLERTKQVV